MDMRKLYALAALAAIPVAALARPATPEIGRYTNPDGQVIEYRVHGNEHFHYITTADNSSILELNGKTMSPMMRNGVTLTPTEATLSMLRAELPEDPACSHTAASSGKVNRMAALDGNGRSTYPTIGEIHACVILLEYPDTPFSFDNPKELYERLCNEKGYSDFQSKGSAKDYYEACSGGKFSPTFDVYGPIRLEHEAKWYVGDDDPTINGYHHNARFGVAIKEALEALDPDVDFSQYDYDNNGEIDSIFFYYSGYGQADLIAVDPVAAALTVWPHQADFARYTTEYSGTIGLDPIYVDGKRMGPYACSNELNASAKIPADQKPWLDGIGAFCHEYGHVLGLPDLYDVSNSGTPTPGSYTVMDTGSYNSLSTCPPLYSAYEKWVCNWLEYTDPVDNTAYTLNPQTGADANALRLRVPRPGNRYYGEYYVLECRDNTSWDASLPSNGLLIWRINYSNNAWTWNNVNVNGTPNIELIGPSSATTLKGWPGLDGLATYISPASAKLTPACLGGKTPLDCVITNIAFDYDNPEGCPVTLEYNVYGENNATTLLHSNVENDQAARTLTFHWDEVEGATNYQLTVKRRDSSGREMVVGDLDETPVGNVNQYLLRNISALQWSQTFTAYVRPVIGIPSTVTSNVLTFVPADLPEYNSVAEIDLDNVIIRGGKGEIIAPEGARAFNLSGVETGLTGLPAGVYIVTLNGASAKVVVK